MNLRKGQKELVNEYRSGYCAVPAIPGGGKTHCLSLWAVEIIERKLHKPGKILIVTYMNTAVNNFKQRISRELQRREISGSRDYFISTIHGLCLQIIKEKPDVLLTNEEFKIIDDLKKSNLVRRAINDWKVHNLEWFKFYVNDNSNLSKNKIKDYYHKWDERLGSIVLAVIADFKTRGITPLEANKKCSQLGDDSLLKLSAQVYERYDRLLKMQGYLDFDDMLYNAKRMLLEDEGLLEKYRSKYPFVCEDEAQDSNFIQSDILKLIANGNLLRVGDSNQAICGSFTNSDFKLFKEFCNDENTTVYRITESSRNSKEIINLANYFIDYVRNEHPVLECRDSLIEQYIEPVGANDLLQNPVLPNYGICTEFFDSWQKEAFRIVNIVRGMVSKYPEKTIAILVPSSWMMNTIVDLMDQRNMKYEELSNTSEERNKSLKVLGRVIDFVAMPHDCTKFSKMIDECFYHLFVDRTQKYDEEYEKKILAEKDQLRQFLHKYPVENILYPVGGVVDLKGIDEEILALSIWDKFMGKLDLIKDILEFPLTVVEKLIIYISEKLGFCMEERAIAQKVAGDVQYLMSDNVNWRLSDLSAELLNSKNMFNFFAGVVWELKGYEPTPGVVSVSTYHKAKGLEWDVVFLTGLSNQDFPVELSDRFKGEYWFLKDEYKNPQAIARAELLYILGESVSDDSILESKIENISEKARLLYVGITRAKQYLYMSGYQDPENKYNNGKKICKYLTKINEFISKEREKWVT